MKITTLTVLAVNTEANAFAALMDGGYIDVYDGEQPKFADTPVNGQRRGVTLQLGSPAFAPAKDGAISAHAISSGVAGQDIKATWARIYRADHTTPIMDVSVGTKDATMILPTTTIAAGVVVSCSSFIHVVPRSG